MFLIQEKECTEMNRIVLDINQISDEKKIRYSFLTELQKLIPCTQTSFYLAGVMPSSIANPVSINIDKNFLDIYEKYYCRVDEVIPHICVSSPKAYRYTDILMSNQKSRESSEAFNDFFKPMGAYYTHGMNISWNGCFLGLVVQFRERGDQDFTDREMFLLRQFQKHLSYKLFMLLFEKQTKPGVCVLDRSVLREKYHLSPREIEIVDLILSGYQNQEISDKLFIEVCTVKTHLKNIFMKLNISSRMQIFNLLIDR